MDYKAKLNDLLGFFKNQAELAYELNVSPSAVSRWLAGESVPHKKQCITINSIHQKFCNLPGQITLDDVI